MSLDGGYIGSLDHAIANLHTGRRQGRQQGIQEGYQQGIDEGYQQGIDEGYQQGFENGWNEATEVGNEKLLEQLGYTRQHFTRVTELERLYNLTMIFTKAMREVLKELTSDRSPSADHVRHLFAEKYAYQVSHGLEVGEIKVTPEADDEFAKVLPYTHNFIVDMLSKVSQEPHEDRVT